MTYYRDVYKRRGSWWGATDKEQYTNIAKKYFEDYLLTSPIADTILLDGVSISAGVNDNKIDDTLNSKYFLIGFEHEVSLGSIIEWYDEHWIVIRKEKRSFEAYQKVLAIRTNYTLKWIDSFGVLNTANAYIFGTKESKVEEGFKTWNGIYSPTPELSLCAIVPFVQIPLEQRFIIKDLAWKLHKKDLVSVNGILYLTLVEDRVDSFNDDLTNGIANNVNLNTSYIDLGLTGLSLGVNESFTFSPILYQNGEIFTNAIFDYAVENDNVSITNSTITANTIGNSSITVSYETLSVNCPITIVSSLVNTSTVQIVGDDSIKHGRTRTYTVFYNDGSTIIELNSSFSILNNTNNLVTMVTNESTSCSLLANSIGNVGTIVLRASTEYGDYDKSVSVVSIW